jgi:Uma2 family endonuclease
MVRMLPKIQEYLSIGIEYVWLIDPYEKSAICYSRDNSAGQVVNVLRTAKPEIEITLDAAFDLNA